MQSPGTEAANVRSTQAAPQRVRRALYDDLRVDSPPSLPPSPPAEDHSPCGDRPTLRSVSPQRTP
eukprot:3009097-Pleurochrysis_carterae.AAC.1